MRNQGEVFVAALLSCLLAAVATAVEPAASGPEAVTVDEAYPNLASGALVFATLAELPQGRIVQAGPLSITQDDLAAEMGKTPEPDRTELMRNQFFVLEQLATRGLLLQLGRAQATRNDDEATTRTERRVIGDYLDQVASEVSVTDEDVSAFYEENKEMCGGATLEQVKIGLKEYVLQQKQEEAVTEHIRTLGRRLPIQVSSSWVKEQSVSAMDNPVDKVRQSGRPSLVDFGSVGCGPCDMMAPILETLAEKYEGKANVQFVHVGEQQILAARYGIQTIPVQVFFDKTGKEVYRHTGFFPQEEIEKRMAQMGVQ